jgi:hypothetical protein
VSKGEGQQRWSRMISKGFLHRHVCFVVSIHRVFGMSRSCHLAMRPSLVYVLNPWKLLLLVLTIDIFISLHKYFMTT